MITHSKRFRELKSKVQPQMYEIPEAVKLVKELAKTKFDESVDISIKLGIDHQKEHVRGTAILPYGTGKTKRVLVFAEGAKIKEAESAGADFVGSDELLKRIEDGWFDFDSVVATPNLMPKISKLGKVLGPKGLMPNPKTGTVTEDVAKAVKEIKLGKVEFKLDKGGCIHCTVGKISFEEEKLNENVTHLLKAIFGAKPVGSKGTYFKSVYISSTMGPGVKLNITSLKF
ncbi:MAG: 50S ribosomal protein L1 [bacterium]